MSLLTLIEAIEMNDRQTEDNSESGLRKKVSLSYSFITLKLDISNKQPGQDKYSTQLYLQCTFQIDEQRTLCTEVYCHDADREDEVKNFILQRTPAAGYPWNTSLNRKTYNREIVYYIAIADKIAKKGYSCSSGDNYKPGYFSEIIIEENRIILKQINHWNSRSIFHKDDYHLRDLEFFIPLCADSKQESTNHDFQIGQMRIRFSDRSSENNRHCGNAIMEKIMEEKALFEKLLT
jgi:hypothetical protein